MRVLVIEDERKLSQHITTALGDVIPMDMGYKLPVDINSHVFSKYTTVFTNQIY